jgi:hypothetical protein
VTGDLTLGQIKSSTKPLNTGLNPKEEITEAEKLLFLNKDFNNIKTPKTLFYHYEGKGETISYNKKSFQIELKNNSNGIILTGMSFENKKREPLKRILNPENNPIILYYLEYDILQMQRLTKGKHNYFRRRIRAALAEGPAIFSEEKVINGKITTLKKFSIMPYATDPLRFSAGRAKYRRYSKKKYTFYTSDQIPGHLYSIEYEIPKRKKKGNNKDFYGQETFIFSDKPPTN